MGNCLLGSEKRTEKATKLAEASVAEYQVRYEVAHQTWENAVRVRQQVVAQHLKSVPKSERADYVKAGATVGAKRVQEAHTSVLHAERELNSAKGLLGVARNMLRMAQAQTQAQAARKMADDFTKLLPHGDMKDISVKFDEFAERRVEMDDLHVDVLDAMRDSNEPEAVDDEDWLNGGMDLNVDEEDEVVEHVAEPQDRKVSVAPGRLKSPTAPRVTRPQHQPSVELLE